MGFITKKKIATLLLCAVALISGCGGNEAKTEVRENSETAIETSKENSETNTEMVESQKEEQRVESALKDIKTNVDLWAEGTISYDDVLIKLEGYKSDKNENVSTEAVSKIEYIKFEESNRIIYIEAAELLENNEYLKSMEKINAVDLKYSNYSKVEELYNNLKGKVLEEVKTPETEKDFLNFIELLKGINALREDNSLNVRLNELNDELVIFRDISSIIDSAADLYDNGSVGDSFLMLLLGLEKYPEDLRLSDSLVNFHDNYIISTTQKVKKLCETKEYKEALAILETAVGEYECDEFNQLIIEVKELKNPVYKLKNDVVAKVKELSQNWNSETFDVRQMADSAGSYIIKSGKRLALGDYSGENVTVLSLGGDIVSSLAGVDFLFDLRDLTYDVAHWDKQDYFVLNLAADVVALVPVVGALKYLEHVKYLDKTADTIDSVKDIGKHSDEIIDSAGTIIKQSAKNADEVIDTLKNAKKIDNAVDSAKTVSKKIKNGYEVIDTPNSRLLGKVHDVTKVKFVERKLIYSDGRKIIGVFPKFKSFSEVELPKELYKADFNEQKKYCMEQLQKQTGGLFAKYKKNFSEDELKDIADGILPEGYVWHHNEKEGLMQLVDAVTHDKTAHTGGMSLWGKGYK